MARLSSGLMDESNDYNAYLTNGAITDPISTEGATVISFWTNLVNYTAVGYYHILPLGLDHILFIVGLFLLSTRLKTPAVAGNDFHPRALDLRWRLGCWAF